MKTSKRLLTVLMCIAMVLSMMSNFAFALGGAASTEATNVAVLGDSSTVGPNPTTNVVAPVITESTIVVDSDATQEAVDAGTYEINFADLSVGEKAYLDESEWIATWGTNLFTDINSAFNAAPTGSTILVKKVASTISIGDGSSSGRDLKFYSQYFNVKPYTIAGTAKDGSDWAIDSSWYEKAPQIKYYTIKNGVGDHQFYGFTFTNQYRVDSTAYSSTTPIKLTFYNCIFMDSWGTNESNTNIKSVAGSEFLYKNVVFDTNPADNTTNTYSYGTGWQADTLTFDGCFVSGATASGSLWLKQGYHKKADTKWIVKNCNFQNTTWNWVLQGGDSGYAYNESNTKLLEFSNNIFKNSTLGGTGGAPAGSVLSRIYLRGYSDIVVSNNIVINSSGTNQALFGSYDASVSAGYAPKVTVTGNTLNGISTTLDFSAISATLGAESVIKDNFATAAYTADIENATGVIVTATGAGSVSGADNNFDAYVDYARKTKYSSIAITGIETSNGNISTTASDYGIFWARTSGSAADLTVSVPTGVTVTWHTAKDGAAVDASSITETGTYYLKVANSAASLIYTVTIAVPEKLFTETFVEDGIIKNTAVLYDSASASTATGHFYLGTWRGTEYNFVKGTNVFSTIDDAISYFKANNITDGQVLVKTDPGSHIKVSYPASFYTQNYDISPVIELTTPLEDGTDKASNIGTGAGQFNTANSIQLDGVSVEQDAIAGEYGFYGFYLTYDIYNKAFADVTMTVKNTYMRIGHTDGFFTGTTENSDAKAAYKAGGFTNKTYLDNMYFTSTNAQGPRLMATGNATNIFKVTNSFYDIPETSTTSAETYTNFYGANHTLTFENCTFKNMRADTVHTPGQTSVNSGDKKEVIYTNNTFVNSWLSAYAVVPVTADHLSYFEMTGNKIYNSVANAKPLIAKDTSYALTPSADLTLVIKDNYEQYGVQSIGLSNRKLSDNSVISGNYLLVNEEQTQGISHKYVDNTNLVSNYILDLATETLNTQLEFTTVTLADGVEGSIVLDNFTKTINYNYADDSSTIADIILTAPEGVTVEFADQGEVIAEEDYEYYDTSFEVLEVITSLDNGVSFTYKLNFVAPSENLFEDVYVSEDDLIDKDKALLLTNEDDLADASDSSIVTLTWCGVEYDFVKGKTAFTSLAALEAYAAEKQIDTPHILVKNKTEAQALYLTAPAHVFTQNYASDPIAEGTEKDGSDWTSNFGTDDGQFDTSEGVDVIYDNVGTETGTAGDYWFYGFTVKYHVVDKTKADTNVKLINSRYLTNNWAAGTEHGNALVVSTNKGAYTVDGETVNDNNSLEMKNVYIGLSSGDTPGFINIDSYIPESFVLDTVFVDVPNGTAPCADSFTVRQYGADTEIVIKNSLFRNYELNEWIFSANAEVVADDSRTITFDNNIFINSQFRNNYDGLVCYMPNFFTGLTITNNYVSNANGTALCSTFGAGDVIEGAPFKLVVTGNYFDYVSNNYQYMKDRNYTSDSVVEGNYFAVGANAEYGSHFYIRGEVADENGSTTKLVSETWYLDKAMTDLSNELQDNYLFNTGVFESEMTYQAGTKETVVDIATLIDTQGNYITGYVDEDCETAVNLSKVAVAAKGTTIYLKVESPDGITGTATVTDPTIYKLTINRKDGAYLNNEGKGSTAANEGNYWVSWRGEYIVTGSEATAADTTKHRVGTIYYSSITTDAETGKTNLDDIKAAIVAGMTGATSIDDIETVVADINTDRASANIDRVYVLGKLKTLTWNNDTQSYGYYYNFNVPADYYRGAIMYAVYEDASGNIQVEFSEGVIQQSGK